jgi:hypothetical protein
MWLKEIQTIELTEPKKEHEQQLEGNFYGTYGFVFLNDSKAHENEKTSCFYLYLKDEKVLERAKTPTGKDMSTYETLKLLYPKLKQKLRNSKLKVI